MTTGQRIPDDERLAAIRKERDRELLLLTNALRRFPFSGAVSLPRWSGGLESLDDIIQTIDELAARVRAHIDKANSAEAELHSLQRDVAGARRILGLT